MDDVTPMPRSKHVPFSTLINDGSGVVVPNGALSPENAKLYATELAPDALNALAKVMREGSSDSAKVAAANAILERAYGKGEPVVNLTAQNMVVQVEFV